MDPRQALVTSGVCVVSGASAGVGRALAIELGAAGARVALLARNERRLRSAVADVEHAGGDARYYVVDVTDANAVEGAAERVERDFGRPITVWVNNAMVTVLSPVQQMRPEEYHQVIRVNFLGTVHGTLSALRRMRPRRNGHIINIGSALAYRAIPLQSAYCASKHAIRAFTDSLRCELIAEDSPILLTMPQLPAMNTPQFQWCRTRLAKQPQPVPPIYDPCLVARAIARGVGKRQREPYLGFSTVKAIFGNKLSPGLLDRYLAATGFSGQQSARALPSDHGDNLFQSDERTVGVHGPFTDRVHRRSPQMWLTSRLRTPALPAAAVTAFALIVLVWQWLN